MTDAVEALREGKPVVLPFDTVYGLAADPNQEPAVRRLYELKGRAETDPSALVARDFDYLLECVPELRGHVAERARLLLPGPVTLVLANPAGRFRWLTGTNPGAIGVRVPSFDGPRRRRPRACRRCRGDQREPSRRPRSDSGSTRCPKRSGREQGRWWTAASCPGARRP